jgi:hypothetical protein
MGGGQSRAGLCGLRIPQAIHLYLANPLFHLAVGPDQLGGGVLTNSIAHQIGIQNPESSAQISGFAAQPEDPESLNTRLFLNLGCWLFLNGAKGASIS